MLIERLGIVFMGSSLEFAVIPRGQGLAYSGGPGLCLVGEWQCGTRQSLIILEGAHNLPSRAVQSSEARPTTTNSYVVRICLHTYTCLSRTNAFFLMI